MLGGVKTKSSAGLTGTKYSGGGKAPGVKEISLSSTPLLGSGSNKQLKIVVKSLKIGQFSHFELIGVCAVVFVAPTPQAHQTFQVSHMTIT